MQKAIFIDLSSEGSVKSSDSYSVTTIPQSPRKQRRPCIISASTDTGTPSKTRSWKAYWTRSSKRYRDPETPISYKRRKMEPAEGEDPSLWSPEFERIFPAFYNDRSDLHCRTVSD
ncbi:uncharacterized protein LOC132163097 [Corylus avellana]|uniref:uncharacterized protein LOC132163097 n=1 Tax=Corylus avellana TaxID=13451 RepID=UPI00286C81C7|nr:uncharacterized protein LOC132163097 [Corylus avellana]